MYLVYKIHSSSATFSNFSSSPSVPSHLDASLVLNFSLPWEGGEINQQNPDLLKQETIGPLGFICLPSPILPFLSLPLNSGATRDSWMRVGARFFWKLFKIWPYSHSFASPLEGHWEGGAVQILVNFAKIFVMFLIVLFHSLCFLPSQHTILSSHVSHVLWSSISGT